MNIAAILTLNVNEDMLQMWPLYNNKGSKKSNSKNSFTSVDQIADRRLTSNRNIPFLSGVLMIYENKQGNLVCYKLYEHK